MFEKPLRGRFFQIILNPVKALKGFLKMFLECLAQCGLRGGSGVEERLIIEWTVIERNVLQCARPTIFFYKVQFRGHCKIQFHVVLKYKSN